MGKYHLVVVGGAGVDCASMSIANYNSYPQGLEVLRELDGIEGVQHLTGVPAHSTIAIRACRAATSRSRRQRRRHDT